LVPTGIDHPIIACRDPDGAATQIEQRLGLRAGGGGRHAAHGTFNRLIWLGDSYIELMGVFDPSRAERSWWGAHVAALLASSDAALAGIALAADDVDAEVARLRGHGSPVGEPVAGERTRPDGEIVRWSIGRLPEPDPEVGLLFLIEHDTSSAEWRPAERAARATEMHPAGGPFRLERVEIPVAGTAASTMRLLRGLGLMFRPSLAGGGARDCSLGDQTLRLWPAGAPGMPTFVLRGRGRPRDERLLGCRWIVRDL
jgi:hypothetical protein